jgi:outer membrane lipoprotein-sorting protein
MTRQPWMTVVLALAMTASAAATPADDLTRAADKFAAAKTFHATMTTGRRVSEIDYAAPDRWHMVTAPSESYVIGSTVYVKAGSSWMKLPIPGTQALTDQLRSPGQIRAHVASLNITDEGTDTDGHKYAYDEASHGYSIHVVMWIGIVDGLPHKMLVTPQGKGSPVTVIYSRYNEPITVTPPA